MLCAITRGGYKDKKIKDQKYKNDFWRGRRSIEISSFHVDEGKTEILFVLYMENKQANGEKNYLYLLHPGNVKFSVVDFRWPPPSHPDEPKQAKNILEEIYDYAFKQQDNKLYQKYGLSAWDSWYGCKEEEVVLWPKDEKEFKWGNKEKLDESDLAKCIEKIPINKEAENTKVPFTEVRLGPFTQSGPVLLACRISIEGEPYEKFVSNHSIFTVDGPERLLLRIEREYIRESDLTEKPIWLEYLEPFRDYIESGESYDFILLKHDKSPKVSSVLETGIRKAPLQPPEKYNAERYISANASFCLSLSFVDQINKMKLKA